MNLENIKNYIWLLNIIAATLGLILTFIPIVHHSELGLSSDYFLVGFKMDHYPIGDQPTYYESSTLIYRVGMTTLIIIVIGSILLIMSSLPLLKEKLNAWPKAWIFSIFWLFCGLLMISGIIYYYLGMNSVDSSFWNYWSLSGGIVVLIGGAIAISSAIFREIAPKLIKNR
ncbi:MAG: hypothetical protein ACFFFB_18350 [Candidatus Heimdallarchaeota archaeon]